MLNFHPLYYHLLNRMMIILLPSVGLEDVPLILIGTSNLAKGNKYIRAPPREARRHNRKKHPE